MEFEKTDKSSTQFIQASHQQNNDGTNFMRKHHEDREMLSDEKGVQSDYEETEADPDGFFADTKTAAACSVRVALRVRPLIGRELFESPNICVKCIPDNNQLIIGKDRAFTFDKIFDIETKQQDVFEVCVKNLVLGCFLGYNATVLAYGQTGSGKTHTMGSGYTIGLRDEDLGIIPRVIHLIFEEVDKRKNKAEFIIKCTFLEIYNEELHDLLDHNGSMNSNIAQSVGVIDRFMQKKEIAIREEKNGTISVYGLREEKVNCYEELAACLDRGSNFRSTASTLMNNCSSRSHAIFTISIEQHVIEDLYKANDVPTQQNQQQQPPETSTSSEEFMVAKFHFVDLAGSERAKRTGATGATLKEGISINKGLLSLGNVISALTEEGKKNGHVPYRDSKLTRILQDSLGGNSRTSMIACVSPAEINFEETLNTLKYASRARNIKNKPIVNRDPNSAQIAQLRQQLYELQREILSCRKLLISNNIEFESNALIPNDINFQGDQKSSSNDFHQKEYVLGAQEIQKYEQEVKELKVEKSQNNKKLILAISQNDSLKEQLSQSQFDHFQLQKERDIARFQLEQITLVLKNKGILQEVLNEVGTSNKAFRNEKMDIDEGEIDGGDSILNSFLQSTGPTILEEYQLKVEEQRKELCDKTQMLKQLQKDYELMFESSEHENKMLESKENEIERLKRSVNKLQKENIQIRNEQRKGSSKLSSYTAPQPHFQSSSYKQQQSSVEKKQKQQTNHSPFAQPKKKLQQPLQDASNNQQWLSNELDYNIKHFNELFIENLSQSLSTMLIAKRPSLPGVNSINVQKTPNQDDDDRFEDDVVSNLGGGFNINGDTDVVMSNNNKSNESSDSECNDEQEQRDQIENDQEQQQQLVEEEMVVIQSIQVQQEIIESNEELKIVDEQMKSNLDSQEQQIIYIDGDIKDKEALLQVIKNSQKSLQNNLLEAMKNEYHKKIQQLEQDMKTIEKERTETLKKTDNQQQKTKLEETYKKKMKDLEEKLTLFKQKDKEQSGMMKEQTKQKTRIKELETEMDKMKQQKVSIMRKLKIELEEHRKWKSERALELLRSKQSGAKKDREIDKLKKDNKRKEAMGKRKQEEINALQKKSQNEKKKKQDGEKQRRQKKNIDIGKIQEWILTNTSKMLRYKEMHQARQSEVDVATNAEEQISDEQKQMASLTVRKEKLEVKMNQAQNSQDEEAQYYINEELQQIELELKAIQEDIESLEEKLDFVNMKISNIDTELIGLSPDDIEQLQFEQVQSIEGARACLGAFFTILLDVNVQNKQLQANSFQSESTIDQLKMQIDELTNIQKANEINFQKQLELLDREYSQKEEVLVKVIMENGVQGIGNEGTNGDWKQTNEFFRQYLKSKENELQSDSQQNGIPSIPNLSNLNSQNQSQIPKRQNPIQTQNKAIELKKQKEQQFNQSKTALSRRVAELERKSKDEEKKFESMRHKFEQTNQEKDQFKRQLDNYKQKVKTQELLELRQSKVLVTGSTIDEGGIGYNTNSKSPKSIDKQLQLQQQQQQKPILTLHEVRKERKIKKLGTQSSVENKSNKYMNDPKVYADEPMEDEENESPKSVKEDAKNNTFTTGVNNACNAPVQRRNTTVSTGDNVITQQIQKSQYLQQNQIQQQQQQDTDQQSQKQSMIEQQNQSEQNVFARLSQANRRANNSISLNSSQQLLTQQQIQQQQEPVQASGINGYEDDHKWKCIGVPKEAHSHYICQLASVGNQLYSTSNKSLKIWDIDTMSCVSDIQAHTGFIKSMTTWESKNLLITASEKVINLWDLISLTNVGKLVGHRDEIRTMTVSQEGNLMFSAGKGSSNGGALLIWDLRKGATPLEEKEKSQDIFSLCSAPGGDLLFMGCRNHQVYPFNVRTMETLSPFDPPHFDAVSSLQILDGTLISGSRDKNLRCWDYNNMQNKYSDVMQAHSDWITAMETDQSKQDLYSASKDGIVKVWKLKKKKLKCTAALTSNAGAVFCMTKIDSGFGQMFAQGCSDKCIRMWKKKEGKANNVRQNSSPFGDIEKDDDMQNIMDQDGDDNNPYNIDKNLDFDDIVTEKVNGDVMTYHNDRLQSQKSCPVNYQNNQQYQPGRPSQYNASQNASNANKLQQMRRQKRLQGKQQKENESQQYQMTDHQQ